MDAHKRMRDGPIEIVKNRGKPFSTITWYFLIIICTIGYSSYSILVNLSKVDGRLPYSSAFLYLVIEMTKLATSLLFWSVERTSLPSLPTSSSSALPTSSSSSARISTTSFPYVMSFFVPAVLYCCTNNIALHLQLEMDPATYQVLGNLKMLSTAVLYRVIMKRVLSLSQWLALFILFLSACLNGLGGIYQSPPSSSPPSSSSSSTSSSTFVTWWGLVGISLYTMMSGLAGVYNEYALKHHKEMSINVQNSILYAFGVTLNALVWLPSLTPGTMNPFKDFNIYVWMVIFSQSMIGLVMSLVMKHSSNVTKLFIVASSALLTTLLSVVVLSIHVDWYFAVSLLLFLSSLTLYYGM